MSKFFALSFCCLCSMATFTDIRADTRANTRPDSHAPIGVMGDHIHEKGEWMLSFRTMTMSMQGNLQGTSSLSPEEIVQTQANGFAGMPMQPANLRVVPVKMTMQMQMLGVMYAPTDRVTLTAMTSYRNIEMDHVTFMGGMGTQRLGTFTTKTSGLGDTQVAALIKLGGNTGASWHGTLGLSLPTGDIEETDEILTPMNMRPTVRLPYPMQLGSGSFDLISGLTYSDHGTDHNTKLGWGSQWRSVWRVEDNSEDYRLGDEHQLSTWASYIVAPSVSLSGRLTYMYKGNIRGKDALIIAPVQTADPNRHKRQRIDAGIGANWVLPNENYRLGLEFTVPIWQRLAGPQLETDWGLSLGLQWSPSA
ncbi:MAG: hypothetical protein ACI8RT_000800 [Candidatus Azotimanducaceae bacterium]|jgi:hypothetical protein